MEKKLTQTIVLRYPDRLTRAGKVLADTLEATGRPIVTPYDLFQQIIAIYKSGQNLYLRKDIPELDDYRRLRRNLIEANIIASDRDYGHRAYRVLSISDLPADDICCLVDPFCYISHLSAMQRYGLTDRRPDSLHLSRAIAKILRQMADEKMRDDALKTALSAPSTVPLSVAQHPPRVRGRKVYVFQTAHPGKSVPVRASSARISTIGQTFADMVEEPSFCGGMSHVLDVWKQHAKIYLDDIIAAVDNSHSSIAIVRAGYILDELLATNDSRIDRWTKFAQRGGSRLLDPTKPYAPTYSERWMISVNV
jgi:predicted transcriptional regulator of viral defense system